MKAYSAARLVNPLVAKSMGIMEMKEAVKDLVEFDFDELREATHRDTLMSYQSTLRKWIPSLSLSGLKLRGLRSMMLTLQRREKKILAI